MVPHNVTLQAHVVVEALVTVLALEGLLPGVHTQVGFKVARLGEGATAELTHVLPHTSVHHDVSFHVVLIAELHRTMGTCISFGAPVSFQVFVAGKDFGKRLGTVRAFVWFITGGVGFLMGMFVMFCFKGGQTELAEVLIAFLVDHAMEFEGVCVHASLATNDAGKRFDFILACMRLAGIEKGTAFWTKTTGLFVFRQFRFRT